MRRSVGACFRAALGWWAALAIVRARELDPAACSARFDVQRDKIIRTEESREMGARYLSELDVGTRHECLRLCCETDSCDVFVYEEKSPSSCYLFNCGPPEDFRCKFTAHGNFSSGVLALSRRLAELQDQERLAHHEQELANLRGATSTTAAPTTPATTTPAPPPPRPPDPPGRCSRYQFECRRGGECIAVYNACDGVPQCADGSDEAPELGCPAPAPPPAPPAPPRPAPPAPAPPPRQHQRPPPTPEPEPPTHPPPQIKPMQMLGDLVEGEGLRDAGEAAELPPERWPHRLAQAQPPPPPPPHRYNVAAAAEVSRGSHIFAHKGGLLQEAEGAPPQYAPFDPPSPWARRLWPQPQTGVEWGAAAGWGETDPRRAWPVPPAPRQEMPVYVPPKTMPELPVEYAGAPPPLRDAAKKGPPASASASAPTPAPAPAPPSPAPRPPPAPTPAPPPPAHNRDHEEHNHEQGAIAGAGVAVAAVPLAADERDGLSDHPPAAILLLVLGVAMTAVLGGMVGCRARAARRRMRRGKSPLAHDADYLVNGMYL